MTEATKQAFEESMPVLEWARRRSLSPSSLYRSLKRGDAPATFCVGRLRFVSASADAAWLREREGKQS